MDIQVEFSGHCYIAGALICLVLPLPWILAAMTAAMVHEIFHILAVFLSGGRINAVRIGVSGAVITSSFMTVPQRSLCILAGPAGSLLLILTGRCMPKLALCGFVQGMFNLLPLYPLDGGRVLRCITGSIFLPETADVICSWTEKAVVLTALCLGFWASFIQKLGIVPVMISLLLVSKVRSGKKSCKERLSGVQ